MKLAIVDAPRPPLETLSPARQELASAIERAAETLPDIEAKAAAIDRARSLVVAEGAARERVQKLENQAAGAVAAWARGQTTGEINLPLSDELAEARSSLAKAETLANAARQALDLMTTEVNAACAARGIAVESVKPAVIAVILEDTEKLRAEQLAGERHVAELTGQLQGAFTALARFGGDGSQLNELRRAINPLRDRAAPPIHSDPVLVDKWRNLAEQLFENPAAKLEL